MLARVAATARAVPRAILERFCDRLACVPEESGEARVLSLLGEVQQQPARQQLAGLISAWKKWDYAVRPDQLAWALRAAAAADEEHQKLQQVELVWTGPTTNEMAARRTEGALLQVIGCARERLFLVTYVGYKIPHICDALGAAIERGVQVHFIGETPETGGPGIAQAASRSLGAPLAGMVNLYVWPAQRRPATDSGDRGALHAKCVVADESAMFVSSANLTGYALALNMELGLLVRGGDLPGRVASHLNDLIRQGVLVRVQPDG